MASADTEYASDGYSECLRKLANQGDKEAIAELDKKDNSPVFFECANCGKYFKELIRQPTLDRLCIKCDKRVNKHNLTKPTL